MESRFLISITRKDGTSVVLHPGATGELDFVKNVVDRTIAKGVGMFHSEAQVKVALQAALEEALYDLKSEVRGVY